MDGMSFVQEVRIKRNNKELYIIMVTSESGSKEILEALKNGVNDYIVKPFPPNTLIDKVKAVIG